MDCIERGRLSERGDKSRSSSSLSPSWQIRSNASCSAPGRCHRRCTSAREAAATAGTGAFFPLKNARRGDRIRVVMASGRSVTYRVQSVKTMLKAKLPLGVWSTKGAHRLVLVTCGGPFDTSIGHYRDNVVVTALPIS